MGIKILILSCVFPPEPVVSARLSEQVARGLQECGDSVTVIAPYPSRPGGKLYSGFRRALYSRYLQPAGYSLLRCFSVPSPSASSASRLLENLVFGLTSSALLAVLPRPDVVYSNSWPIFATGLMALVARLRRIPYVVSIQDVYPESFAAQGRGLRGGLAFRLMRWIDCQVALHASHLIVLSEPFADVYTSDRGVPRERISVIPNWVEEEDLIDSVEAAALRRRFSISLDGFLVAFGGNIGVAAGVETVVKAFAHTDPGVYGLIAGEGSQLANCQQLASAIAPTRISFLTPWPVDQTMPLYQAADLLVLPTRGEQSMASVPSKMLRYMLSGRPVLATGLPGSDLARLIEESQCGWLISPDDPAALAAGISRARQLPAAELNRRGMAGRSYVLEHYISQACLPKVIQIIEEAAR